MLFPVDLRAWASQRLSNQRRAWLDGGGNWPLQRSLVPPTAIDIRDNLSSVRQWTSAWSSFALPSGVTVTRESRAMRGIGSQTLPINIIFDSPRAVAAIAGSLESWDKVTRRRGRLLEIWPDLVQRNVLGRLYDWLDQATDEDLDRLIAVSRWVLDYPNSGLYLRQLPVPGVDTKWVEGGQRRAIAQLVSMLRGEEGATADTEKDFLRLCGLKAPAQRIRIMVLCPQLRVQVGGVRDLYAPVQELANIPWQPRTTIFVENLACSYSLPDLPSAIALVGLGRAVSLAADLPWIHRSRSLYWGDIDTDGLEILSLARGCFPELHSLLMDRETLMQYPKRWVPEPAPNERADRSRLTTEERGLYDELLANDWNASGWEFVADDWKARGWDLSRRVRLEQERLDWPQVEFALRLAVDTQLRALD